VLMPITSVFRSKALMGATERRSNLYAQGHR
jgi:hypothetical protein